MSISSTQTVTGDGTTAKDRARTRWRKHGWLVAIAAMLAILVAIQIFTSPASSTIPFAPNNAGDSGGRAVSEILKRQGVEVHFTDSVASTSREIDHVGASATLLIAADSGITTEQAARLANRTTATVLLAPGDDLLKAIAPAISNHFLPPATAPVPASCQDPDAISAEKITPIDAWLTVNTELEPGSGSPVECFSNGTASAMIRLDAITVLGSWQPFSNKHLADDGNATLGLRVLGSQPALIWLVPNPKLLDEGTAAAQSNASAWLRVVIWFVILIFVLLIWWRAPRFGPLVAESLPVVVPSGEVTRGRARLYRQARDHAHAARALRTSAATNIAQRIGLDASVARPVFVSAVARASGRETSDIEALFYSPPPRQAAGLQSLTKSLDQLTREVRRP